MIHDPELQKLRTVMVTMETILMKGNGVDLTMRMEMIKKMLQPLMITGRNSINTLKTYFQQFLNLLK